MLRERTAADRENEKRFHVNSGQLNQYSHQLGAGGCNTKDFRPAISVETEMAALGKNPARAKSQKDYKKRVMEIGKIVAKKLGNTPSRAV